MVSPQKYLQTEDPIQFNPRQSSAHYAQSNGRAEAAVKSSKRILREIINPVTGELNTESAVRAILSHRNTPAQETGISPAMSLYGHPLRDHLPTPKKLRQEWLKIKEDRERALAAYQQSTLGKIDRTVNPRRHGASAEPGWKPVKEMGKDGNHHGEATKPAI